MKRVNMKLKTSWIGGILAVAAIIAYLTFFNSNPYRGSIIKPPIVAAPIALTDSNDNSFQLDSQRGRIVLVFFGFTNCVDQCPLAMAKLKQTLQELGDQSKDVQVLLVTTDPARDTVAQLNRYVSAFDPTFLGLTGSLDELQTIWSAYGVVVEDGGETHSELIYVIDRSGQLRLTFSSDLQYQDIVHDVKILLAEK